ncbi:MAG TPA: ABC transporter ATP-binding protein [Gammaproteobacteria bacterium]|nr:ABC transporter ATP-binding protein [Gammaproteobacteria bacterium]
MLEIEARGLVKCFGTLRAVDGVTFDVRRGETFGLLGPNGAGKTSIMRMMAGLTPITSGTLRIAGIDVASDSRAVRAQLGVVTQNDGLDREISVRQNLEIFGYLAGLPRPEARRRAAEVLEFFELADRARDDVADLSGGLKRRLAIARAFVTRPRVIVLDEPSTGLDPQSRMRVWEELASLKRSAVTLVMSTHYMDEAETLCDRLAMLHAGRILDEGAPHELIARHAGGGTADVRVNGADRDAVRRALVASNQAFREVGALFRVTGRGGRRPELPPLGGAHVTERPANLEDVFLSLSGRGLGDE